MSGPSTVGACSVGSGLTGAGYSSGGRRPTVNSAPARFRSSGTPEDRPAGDRGTHQVRPAGCRPGPAGPAGRRSPTGPGRRPRRVPQHQDQRGGAGAQQLQARTASSTTTSARRTMPPGARLDTCAPTQTPGSAPISRDDGEVELEVAEEQVAERRRRDQRDRLDQVGADQLAGPDASGRAAAAPR